MENPFPGMNPYLEGSLWGDIHGALIHSMADDLSAQAPEHIFVRTEAKTLLIDGQGEEFGKMYPDIYLAQQRYSKRASEHAFEGGASPATLTLAMHEVRTYSLRLLDVRYQQVVTAIELVSPANKFGADFDKYDQKIQDYQVAGVNTVEIDLLRRGRRRYALSAGRQAAYQCAVFNRMRQRVHLWLLDIRERLPMLPVPLGGESSNLLVDVQDHLNSVYRRRRLQRQIDYTAPPLPPALTEAQQEFITAALS